MQDNYQQIFDQEKLKQRQDATEINWKQMKEANRHLIWKYSQKEKDLFMNDKGTLTDDSDLLLGALTPLDKSNNFDIENKLTLLQTEQAKIAVKMHNKSQTLCKWNQMQQDFQ